MEHNLFSDIMRGIKKKIRHGLTSLKLEQLVTKILKQNSNKHKRIGVVGQKCQTVREFRTPFSRAASAKIFAASTRVCRTRWLKIQDLFWNLSHIIGTAPILEMTRAYGLHPWLWLLIPLILVNYLIVSNVIVARHQWRVNSASSILKICILLYSK